MKSENEYLFKYDYLDLDWFAIDDNGNIVHFANGGNGFFPKSVFDSQVEDDKVRDFIFNTKPFTQVKVCEENVSIFKSENERKVFLNSYSEMASRGIHSFDVNNMVEKPCYEYALIASPVKPLNIEGLPEDIKEILNKTRLIKKMPVYKLLWGNQGNELGQALLADADHSQNMND